MHLSKPNSSSRKYNDMAGRQEKQKQHLLFLGWHHFTALRKINSWDVLGKSSLKELEQLAMVQGP